MTSKNDTAFLSAADVARETGISRSTIYRLIERQEIPAVKVGKSVLVPRTWLTDLVNQALRSGHVEQVNVAAIRQNTRRKAA